MAAAPPGLGRCRSIKIAAIAAVFVIGGVGEVGVVLRPDRKDGRAGRDAMGPGRSAVLQALIPFRVRYRDLLHDRPELVKETRFTYTANGGRRRAAFVVLPRWYDVHRHPPIPLVIAPHGRGISAQANLRSWGALPAFGPFALVDPEGQGRRLIRYSWGWPGQIDDLSRMPELVERAVPGLRIDHSRIYAIGSSMGGQETLLLVARHPSLLVGAAALDSATDMAARYQAFAQLRDGRRLRHLAQVEIGGTPTQVPRAYATRSPITFARQIARSHVPLHLWWSIDDRIVRNQNAESGALYREIKRIDPSAPVTKYVGAWAHSREMHPLARLPLVLVKFGLITLDEPLPRNVSIAHRHPRRTGLSPRRSDRRSASEWQRNPNRRRSGCQTHGAGVRADQHDIRSRALHGRLHCGMRE